MSELVMIENGKTYALSHEVAQKFKKEHRTIYRKIEGLIKSQPEFGSANFGVTTYVTDQNKTHNCFQMTRDGFAMIAMSLTGKEAENWKIKYMNAFNAMEDALKTMQPTLTTLNEIVKKSESDKAIASACGSELAKYKKIKKSNETAFEDASKQVQISLGFVK